MSLQTLKKLSSFKAFEIINHLPLFCDLTPEDKRLIANEHNLFCFIPKNDTFITQGDMDKCFYLLLSGSAKVVHDCIDFDELSAGDIIGGHRIYSRSCQNSIRNCSKRYISDEI